MLQGARDNHTFGKRYCSLLTFGPLEFILTHPPTVKQRKRQETSSHSKCARRAEPEGGRKQVN